MGVGVVLCGVVLVLRNGVVLVGVVCSLLFVCLWSTGLLFCVCVYVFVLLGVFVVRCLWC